MFIAIAIILIVAIIVFATFLITAITGAPYVRTERKKLKRALPELYKLKEDDLVIDLGSGDGAVLEVFAASGARALGIELNPFLAVVTKIRFRNAKNVSIKCCNFYNIKFPDETTVVYAYALGHHVGPIYKKIEKESTRIGHKIVFISNAFDHHTIKCDKKYGSFYLYEIKSKRRINK